MYLAEYELRFILGFVLVVCIIRGLFFSWGFSIMKKEIRTKTGEEMEEAYLQEKLSKIEDKHHQG
jgi:hypothetical protein